MSIGHLTIDMDCPTCDAKRDQECYGDDLHDEIRTDTKRRFHKARIVAAREATKASNDALRKARVG